MIPLSLADLATLTGGRLVGAPPDAVVRRVVTDSREIGAGDPPTLFVARRGENADGHDHAAPAVAAGAVAVLADHDLAGLPTIVVGDTSAALLALAAAVRLRLDATVVAVTGSMGKTTTKDLIAAACGGLGPVTAARGSYNNEVGVPLTVLGADADTRVLVAELGARGIGQIAALASWVRPDVGVVTSVAGVHLELFGTVDAIARTKGDLVAMLPDTGTAVLNVDDERVAAMRSRTHAAVVACSPGGRSDADVVAENVHLDRHARPSFRARTPWGSADVAVPVAGRHQVDNALLALAAAGAAGASLDDAARRIGRAEVSSWRGEVLDLGGALVLNDAYNANPPSTMAALDTLAALDVSGRRIAVLGYMAEIGADEDTAHRQVGAYAAKVVDRLIVVGDRAGALAVGAREAGLAPDAITRVPDAAAATDAVGVLGTGDAVLVKASRVAGLDAVARDLDARARGGEVAS